MRVLMTADAVGGVWSYTLELVRALAPFGIDVHVATMGPAPTADQRAAAQLLPNLTLHVCELRLEWMDDCWSDVDMAGTWLLGLERTLAPDVVHLNGYVHAALPWHTPTLVVAHSCVLSWWRATHGTDAPPRYDTYRARVACGLNAADLVVAPTAAMLRMLESCYGRVDQSRVIPNGRTASGGARVEKQRVVLGVGRVWDEAKNLEALARAARRLNVPVRIAGPTSDPHGHPVSMTHVALLGTLDTDALASEYQRAAVFAAPARYEPFGLAALEAGLAHCALVLGDIPTLREVWGDAARYVPADDDAALASTIRQLLNDDALRAELGSRAFRRASSYSAARMADGYRAAYTALSRLRSPAPLALQ